MKFYHFILIFYLSSIKITNCSKSYLMLLKNIVSNIVSRVVVSWVEMFEEKNEFCIIGRWVKGESDLTLYSIVLLSNKKYLLLVYMKTRSTFNQINQFQNVILRQETALRKKHHIIVLKMEPFVLISLFNLYTFDLDKCLKTPCRQNASKLHLDFEQASSTITFWMES